MKKAFVDFNSDMGEGFGAWRVTENHDDEIIQLISSANVAAGFHAGDPNIMNTIIQAAKHYGVGIGAHPGYRDLLGFGRRYINAKPQELINDILYQMGAFAIFARLHDVPIQHVKPHGALYMTLANDEELSAMLIQAVQKVQPDAFIFCMANSATAKAAQKLGQPFVREFYGDRSYNNSGQIVFTRDVGALEPQAIAQKILTACTEGKVQTVEGEWIEIEFDSICVHSDTIGALEIIRQSRAILAEAQIEVINNFTHRKNI